MIDVTHEISSVDRRIGTRTLEAGEARTLVVSRVYDTPPEDLWDACTNPERIPRWFLPVTGDLRLGGRFQLEGNAGGEITECEPPRRLAVTWEFHGAISLVTVDLSAAGGATTELRLRHAVADDEHWATYGPGAVGVGWELGLLGLLLHLRTGASADEGREFVTSPEGREFMRRSAAGWGAAHAAAGVQAAVAEEAAARTTAAYAPDPQPEPS